MRPDPRAVWDAAARLYRFQEPWEARSLSTLVGLVSGPMTGPGARVVDVGAGPGTLTRRLRRDGLRRAGVVAVEPSRRMIAAGRYAGAPVVRADATRLPLADGSVDLVTAGWLLHVLEAPQRAAAVAEAARVLRPGGHFGVVVPGAVPGWGRRSVRGVTRALLRLRGAAGVLQPPADLDDLLAAAGFEVRHDVATGRGYWARVLVARRGGERPDQVAGGPSR